MGLEEPWTSIWQTLSGPLSAILPPDRLILQARLAVEDTGTPLLGRSKGSVQQLLDSHWSR